MSYRHGHIIPIMGNGDEAGKVNTSTNLLAYCTFPTNINARWVLNLRIVATKANSGSANYKFLIQEEGNAAFSTPMAKEIAVAQDYTEPPTYEASFAPNSDLLTRANNALGCELRQSIASGSFGHYIWSTTLEARVG